jgi:hypothetical protein
MKTNLLKTTPYVILFVDDGSFYYVEKAQTPRHAIEQYVKERGEPPTDENTQNIMVVEVASTSRLELTLFPTHVAIELKNEV